MDNMSQWRKQFLAPNHLGDYLLCKTSSSLSNCQIRVFSIVISCSLRLWKIFFLTAKLSAAVSVFNLFEGMTLSCHFKMDSWWRRRFSRPVGIVFCCSIFSWKPDQLMRRILQCCLVIVHKCSRRKPFPQVIFSSLSSHLIQRYIKDLKADGYLVLYKFVSDTAFQSSCFIAYIRNRIEFFQNFHL